MQIVAGGPHVSSLRQVVLQQCPAIDLGVVFEGEQAIVELMTGQDRTRIQGLLWRDGHKINYNGDRPFMIDLDRLGFPTYQRFDNRHNYRRIIEIVSSRGCPYKCIFCGTSLAIGARWRGRTTDHVLQEIEYWYQRGHREFTFVDSNFSLNRKRLRQICRRIADNGFENITFGCQGLRADHLDEESLALMKQANFVDLAFGVESGSNPILKNIRKGETAEQIDHTIGLAVRMGFNVTLFFVIGSPGETPHDIEQSFRLAQRHPVSRVHFFNVAPIPQTQLYNWVEKNDYILKPWQDYLGGNYGFSSEPLFRTDKLSIRQIRKYLRKAATIAKKIKLRHESARTGRTGLFARLSRSLYLLAYRLFLLSPRLRQRWHRFRRQTAAA